MKVKDWLKIIGTGLLLYSPIEAQSINLEIAVQDQSGAALDSSLVCVKLLEGLTTTDFLETKNTGDDNVVNFDIPGAGVFYSFAYKQGYGLEDTTLFLGADEQIILNLDKVPEGRWFPHYLNDDNLELSFNSFDEDIYYEGGNPFDYEVEINNVSDGIISFTNGDLFTACYDSLGNKVQLLREERNTQYYELNLNPKKGWVRMSVLNDTISYYIGGAYGYFESSGFGVAGEFNLDDDEFVSTSFKIRNNAVSGSLNGIHHLYMDLNYILENSTHNINMNSQDFYVENELPPDYPPEIVGHQPEQLDLSRNINDIINFEINAEDADGDPIDYKFLKNDSLVNDTNKYSWNVDRKGSTIIKGIAYNNLADTIGWVINVENRKPAARDTTLNISEEAIINIQKNKLGSDPDGDNLSFRVLEKQNIDANFNNNLILTGLEDYFGSASVTYEIDDGIFKDTGDVSINIENVNDLPIAVTENTTITEEGSVKLDGKQSYHPDSPLNEIVSYEWTQLSGPNVNIINRDSSVAEVDLYKRGIYEFLLTVNDSLNQEAKDTSTVDASILEINSRTPLNYSLKQNYPNPFNSSTTIGYSIPKGGPVLLNVYDIRGKKLETLVNEVQSLGEYEVNFSAEYLPSGIYFYQLEKDDKITTKKMIKLK